MLNGFCIACCGEGNPTALADLENGLWGCDTPNGNNPNLLNLNTTFVTATTALTANARHLADFERMEKP